MGLEDDLKKFEEMHSKEAIEKRTNLATQVSKAFENSMMKWLGKKHGTKKVGDVEVPLMYALGDPKKDYKGAEKDAEEMINYIAENLLTYCFPKANDEDFKVLKKHITANKQQMRALISYKLGVNLNEIEGLLVQYKPNITQSEKLMEAIAHSGINATHHEVMELYQDIKRKDNKDELIKYLGKKLGEKGYEVPKIEQKNMDELGQYLNAIHSGKLEEYAKQPGSEYKKKEKRK